MEVFGFTTCMGKPRLTGGKATYSARVSHKGIVPGKSDVATGRRLVQVVATLR